MSEQPHLKAVNSEQDAGIREPRLVLPSGFKVVPTYEDEGVFNQLFHYHGGMSTNEAIDALMEAGWKVGAKGAGHNAGRIHRDHEGQELSTFHLVEDNIYSRG